MLLVNATGSLKPTDWKSEIFSRHFKPAHRASISIDWFGCVGAYVIIRTTTDNETHASEVSDYQSTFWVLLYFFDQKMSLEVTQFWYHKEGSAKAEHRIPYAPGWVNAFREPQCNSSPKLVLQSKSSFMWLIRKNEWKEGREREEEVGRGPKRMCGWMSK